jgi:hypothetical protein
VRVPIAATFICLVLVAGRAFGSQRANLVPGTTTHRLIAAGMPSGPTTLMVQDDEVEFDLGEGGPRYGRLLTLFNPPSHLYWWAVYPEGERRLGLENGDGFGQDRVAFVSADKLIVFIFFYKKITLS